MFRLREDYVLVEHSFRLREPAVLAAIGSLELNKAPIDMSTASLGSSREIEQYISNVFPQYIVCLFTYKNRYNLTSVDSYEFKSPYNHCDIDSQGRYIYFNNMGVKRQPNIYLMEFSTRKSLIKGCTNSGRAYYLALRLVKIGGGLFRFKEIEEAYQSQDCIEKIRYAK